MELAQIKKEIENTLARLENQRQILADTEFAIDNFDPSEYYDESQHIDFLNETYGTIEVCGMTMDSGTILYSQDYPAFREDMNNYIDSMDLTSIEDYNDLINEMNEQRDIYEDLEQDLEVLYDDEYEIESELK